MASLEDILKALLDGQTKTNENIVKLSQRIDKVEKHQRAGEVEFNIDLPSDAVEYQAEGLRFSPKEERLHAEHAKAETSRQFIPSFTVGGSTDEQLAEQRKIIAEEAARHERERGIVHEGDQVDIAGPTDEQRLLRKQLNKQIGWEHWVRSDQYESTPLPPPEAEAAYVQGGPYWLYHYDRDFVMQQPMAVKQAMVDDLRRTHVELANELGADLLMYREANDASVTMDNILGQHG